MKESVKQENDFPLIEDLVSAVHRIGALGWCRATSGNFSIRDADNSVFISESGKDKSVISSRDFLRVDSKGAVLESLNRVPSAELALHTQLYNRFLHVNVVLHTHSVNSTVLGKVCSQNGIFFHGYEVIKAFPGIQTHEDKVFIPIFDNTQDMGPLSAEVDTYLTANPQTPGYFIRGHGLYTWGKQLVDAMRHLEALEFLIECELSVFRLTGQWSGEGP